MQEPCTTCDWPYVLLQSTIMCPRCIQWSWYAALQTMQILLRVFPQVRNMWEQAKQRQAARLRQERSAGGNPHKKMVKREDLLGPKFRDMSACKALQELQVSTSLSNITRGLACVQHSGAVCDQVLSSKPLGL
jgi:hypothetical protein